MSNLAQDAFHEYLTDLPDENTALRRQLNDILRRLANTDSERRSERYIHLSFEINSKDDNNAQKDIGSRTKTRWECLEWE